MFKITCCYLILCCCAALGVYGQSSPTLELLVRGPIKSIRGMSVVSDQVIWVSGTDGMVGKSTDGGRQWQWLRVKGCDSCDWRSLAAFNEREAVVINAGAPAYVFHTANGGQTWEKVYYNNTKGIFFDGVLFRRAKEGSAIPPKEGLAIGDPLNGRFTMLVTHNGGLKWDTLPPARRPKALTGEAIFAASGTSLQPLGQQACFVTGGDTARFFHLTDKGWQAFALPILQGKASTGAFSVAFKNGGVHGVVVGGDYSNDTLRQQHCLFTLDSGRTWHAPIQPPGGYRSCVAWVGQRTLVATGPSGTDISTDDGQHWTPLSKEGFHVVQVSPNGKGIFLAGSNGRITRLNISQ
ncbi:oxidoreductase [Chitinophaga agrisoli]|uniref:Oxidoreductase n=1 Tax=Chitinophaga agrisoli TaxID=2607653 RepID=A0A5B2VXI7_9BACT|nr:YCF48-related protein [Chitinophaga agrisoli]KAA2243032.1 oxidoreductase [Chitinophaga agrisoli]